MDGGVRCRPPNAPSRRSSPTWNSTAASPTPANGRTNQCRIDPDKVLRHPAGAGAGLAVASLLTLLVRGETERHGGHRHAAIRTFFVTVTWSRSEIRTVTDIVHSPAMGRLTESAAQ